MSDNGAGEESFLTTSLGRTGIRVSRIGLAGTHRPGKQPLESSIDQGVNLFFFFGFDTHMIKMLKEALPGNRDRIVVATGIYNFILGHPNPRRTLEKRLRQLGTDYIDLFLFLGVLSPKHFPDELMEELIRFREEGKVRAIGLSSHDRRFAGQLAQNDEVDVLMIRYNAAYRGAEQDIFPYLSQHDPGLISYTATRWNQLTRRPKNWPRERPIPNAGMCYRFVLSHPNVHVCLSAPSNSEQLEENLSEIRKGPLSEEEMEFMREFGDVVSKKQAWFM